MLNCFLTLLSFPLSSLSKFTKRFLRNYILNIKNEKDCFELLHVIAQTLHQLQEIKENNYESLQDIVMVGEFSKHLLHVIDVY
ncbi:hypothetical protein ES702_04125 [subsurface metagenome]